ncbi:hypothetical protein CEQ21_07410 (plasmid) [Niallia circulans]|uniref:Uncharacterized protein n=1 Tax=Niallia circulans TaxID=1397 RepID=A0A553SQW8_NIACI|nr:hypothetical protein [Niallia circulans]TRZ39381.1 hypothetical protein CEQ21_07410 [Niallia circulans]
MNSSDIQNDNFKYKKLYMFDNKLINSGAVILIVAFAIITSLMGEFNWIDLISFTVVIFLLMFLTAINDYIYRALARKEDINISKFPTTTELDGLEKELRILETLTKGYGVFRVMGRFEKLAFTTTTLLFAVGLLAATILYPLKSYGTLINWLSISAFGVSLMPIIDSSARNRITYKISLIQSKINEIKERQNKNTINKILNIVETLKK